MCPAGEPTDSHQAPSWRLRADRVSWRRVDDEIVALDLQTSEYLALNPTARLLWEALVEGSHLDGLVALVRRRYPDAPVEQVRADVQALIDELGARGLVTPTEP